MMNSYARYAAICCAAMLLVGSAAPQQTPQKPPEEAPAPAIQVEVNLVNILATVHNKGGGLVGNLTKDDFTLNEDGQAQTIKYFTRETDLPLTLGLLVDVSGSQRNLIEIEREAAYQFFSQVLRKKDLAFLISFGEDAELLQDFTSSARLLQGGLQHLQVNSGVQGIHPGPVPTIGQPRGTVLYDAVYLACHDQMTQQVGRKAVVLITDGMDEGSRLKIEEAISGAQRADTVIYSIYYVDRAAYGGFGYFGAVTDSYLRRMSDDTGGRVFKVDRKNTLPDVFKELQDEMRSQYAIGYQPTNDKHDGSFRRVDLRVADKNLKVQARKGYYAPGGKTD
jgi:VWFA-related protein